MNDKLLRWKLRVLAGLVGDAHPFVVTQPLVVRVGSHTVPKVITHYREVPDFPKWRGLK